MVGVVGIEPTCLRPEIYSLLSHRWDITPITHSATDIVRAYPNSLPFGSRMRVIKHTVTHLCDSLVAIPYALLRSDFSSHKRDFILEAAHLLDVYSA